MRKYGMKMFEPIELGPVHLKNRIMMAPCVTFFAKEGHVTDQMIDYYRERAKGGAAMIVVEATYPCLSGRSRRLHLFDGTFIPGLKRLTDTVHEENAKVAL